MLILLQLLAALALATKVAAQSGVKGCVKVCLAVCPQVDAQWRRCIDTWGSAQGCTRGDPEPFLEVSGNECPQIFQGSMYWGPNPNSYSVWGDLSQDMTTCPDGSTPTAVQQTGVFDNLTSCSNFVNAIEGSNLFGEPEQTVGDPHDGVAFKKRVATNSSYKDQLSYWDMSCPTYSSSILSSRSAVSPDFKKSCLIPMSKIAGYAYWDKKKILKYNYCQGSHVEVYNTVSSQNYTKLNLQVMMLSCDNVVIISYRGTTMKLYSDVHKTTSNSTQQQNSTRQKLGWPWDRNWWNWELDLSAKRDLWVVPATETSAFSSTMSNQTKPEAPTSTESAAPEAPEAPETLGAPKAPEAPEGMANAWVHEGFKKAILAVNPAVRTFLSKYYSKSSRLIVTGHSLGGAMTTLGAYDLHHGVQGTAYPVTLAVSFGAPRSLAGSWFSSTSRVTYDVPTIRVTHHKDVVPQVPPRLDFLYSNGMYHHVGREIYLGENCCYAIACNGSGEDDHCGNSGFSFIWSLFQGEIILGLLLLLFLLAL